MNASTIRDLPEYLLTGNAGTYREPASSPLATDADVIDELMNKLLRDGFVVLERLFTDDQVAAMRDVLMPLFSPHKGRNAFEGTRTQRLYAVIEKTLTCNPLVENTLILSLIDRVLQPNYLLSQLQAINILAGEAAQPLHFDDDWYPITRPRPPYGAATVMAIDDFTADNGATVVVPGSHTWDSHVPTDLDLASLRPVVMPSGSVVLFLGTLWHGGGSNCSDASRLAVTAQYCAPWSRQQENFALSTSRERVRQCSERVQGLLGYSIHPPFMGMVGGMHPKRLLE